MKQDKTNLWTLLDKRVFFPPAVTLILIVLLGLYYSEKFATNLSKLLQILFEYCSWFYMLGTTLLLCFCLWAGFSRFGNIKLGGPDAKPTMSTFNWWAISLCAGIGTGIVFWGVAEPMSHYLNPPPFLGINPKSIEAAEVALRYSFFHWSFFPYGVYVSAALAIGLAFYNAKQSFRVSSGLYFLLGKKVDKGWGTLADSITTFAILGGVGTSLGFGTMQIGEGLRYLWGIEPSNSVWLLIIVMITVSFTISSYTGLNKGIKVLSQYNVYMYLLLLAWVLVFGPTTHILDSTISAIGDFLSNIVSMSLYLDPMSKSGWTHNWTTFYWAVWLAYGPIVGLFLVRLGYGRTIREFVIVNLIAPGSFAFIWFGCFGSTSIYLDHFLGTGIAEQIANYGVEVSLFALLKLFPMPKVIATLGLLAIVVSFVTLADSMTSTVASLTTRKDLNTDNAEAPGSIKLFWGVAMGLLSWVLLIGGGMDALKVSSTLVGLPILILQLAMAVSYIKAVYRLYKCDSTSDFDNH